MTLLFPFGSRHHLDGGQTYIEKVLEIQAANMILYHPMNEPSGGTAIDYSPESNDGAYTGVTLGQPGIGDGETCPLFDGANDYNDIYSAGLGSDFDPLKGTAAIWAKVSGVGIWTDDAYHWIGALVVNTNNRVQILKSSGAESNVIRFQYKAGGTAQSIDHATTTTDWFHLAMTWDKTADKVIVYYNGSQTGSTQTSLGVWVGTLVEGSTNIGAQTETPTFVWDGYLAHGLVYKVALSPAEIAELATV